MCNGIACGRYILYIAHSRHLAVLALKLQTSMSKGYSLLNTVFLNLLTLYRLFIAWLLKTFQEGSDSANSIYQDYFIFVNCVTEQKPAAAGQLFLDRAPTLIVVSSCLFSIFENVNLFYFSSISSQGRQYLLFNEFAFHFPYNKWQFRGNIVSIYIFPSKNLILNDAILAQ